MAAEIKPLRSSPVTRPVTSDRPLLVSKIEGGSDDINNAIILCSGSTILSICDDK